MDTTIAAGTFSDSQRRHVLCLMPPNEIPSCAPWIIQQMQGVRVRGMLLYSIEQALVLCERGLMQLWIMRDTEEPEPCLFFLTEIKIYPAGKVINVCLIRGRKMKKAMELFKTEFLAWCRFQDAILLTAEAQPALGKLLIKFGFVPRAVAFNLPLVAMH